MSGVLVPGAGRARDGHRGVDERGAASHGVAEGKERFARFREAVQLIRRLWAEERVTFEGDFYPGVAVALRSYWRSDVLKVRGYGCDT